MEILQKLKINISSLELLIQIPISHSVIEYKLLNCIRILLRNIRREDGIRYLEKCNLKIIC